MKPFPKRHYPGPGAFLADLRSVLKNRAILRAAMRSAPADFRERLMLAVTAVNGCRYCSYFHARQALRAGVPDEHLQALLAGDLPQVAPAFELPALCYAQHWAEQNGLPDPQAAANMRAVYGEAQAAAIEIVLRMIRIGNLLGNSADYLLYRVSFGNIGAGKKVGG